MDFKYKSSAELALMTDTEKETYLVQKREFEANQTKEAVKSQVAEAKKEFDAELKKANDKAETASKNASEIAERLTELETKGDASNKQGTYVAFALKNIKDNPDAENNRTYGAETTIKAAALMTTANVTPNVTNGFSPLFGNYIDTEVGHIPKPDNVILPLVTVKNQPGTESIWYSDRVNEEGDAAFIAEGALKPLADAEWATTKAPIKEVAVRWKFTKRLMMHAPSVVADFYEHAVELVSQVIDDQLLDGDNTGNNLNGLQTVAAAFIVPPQLAEYYPEANIWDVINAMASRIRLSNFKGQINAVLNTVWEAKMMGIKDLEGRYITPPFVTPDGKRVGSVQITFSNKIDDDSILIGELKRFNVVMAEEVTYDEGYENDDFSKNLVSRKLEAFLGTYVKRSAAGSILFDSISSVLTDIAVPPAA